MVQTHSDKSITRFSMQSFSNRLVPAVSPGSARATEAMAPFALQPQTKTPEYGAATAPLRSSGGADRPVAAHGELQNRRMVRPTGFEPVAPRLGI